MYFPTLLVWVSSSVYFVNVSINIRLIAVQVPRTRQLLHTFRSCTIFRSKVAVDMIIIRNVVLIYTNQHDYHLQHFEKPENDHVQLFIPSHVMENQERIELHRNHRPGHYKENVSPLIHGLFSK